MRAVQWHKLPVKELLSPTTHWNPNDFTDQRNSQAPCDACTAAKQQREAERWRSTSPLCTPRLCCWRKCLPSLLLSVVKIGCKHLTDLGLLAFNMSIYLLLDLQSGKQSKPKLSYFFNSESVSSAVMVWASWNQDMGFECLSPKKETFLENTC